MPSRRFRALLLVRAATPAETESDMTPTAAHAVADVLVVFGITGNLARVMTFRSLYRLKKRGLLTCPVVGVAVDDWTIGDLVQQARESIIAMLRSSTTASSTSS